MGCGGDGVMLVIRYDNAEDADDDVGDDGDGKSWSRPWVGMGMGPGSWLSWTDIQT